MDRGNLNRALVNILDAVHHDIDNVTDDANGPGNRERFRDYERSVAALNEALFNDAVLDLVVNVNALNVE